MTTTSSSEITHTVRAKRFWYGPKNTYSYVFRGTLAECKEYIKSSDLEIYHLSHNESGRPDHRIVRIDNLGTYARMEADRAITNAEIESYR